GTCKIHARRASPALYACRARPRRMAWRQAERRIALAAIRCIVSRQGDTMKNAEILWIVALAMLGITLLLLTGCATAEYRERLVAERLAEQDRVCRSWGTTPGTPEYLACRQQLSQQYAAAETQRE